MPGRSRAGRWASRVGVAIAAAAAFPVSTAAAGVTLIPSPNPGTLNTLGGLAAFSPTDIWGVGTASSTSYTGCHGRTLTIRWNGSTFPEVAAPPTPICASVNGVSGTSTSDIWAVGSTNNGRDTHLRHWDGSAWTVVPGASIAVPPSGGRGQRTTGLNAVTEIGPLDAWAVGRAQFSDFSRHTLIEHYNGTWQFVPGPAISGSVLNAVSALGPSNVWAVGAGGGGTLVTHWNGKTWTTVPSPNPNVLNTLRGVAAIANNDIWAVGDAIKSTTDGVSASRTLVEHWNGSSWSIVGSPNVGAGSNVLTGVAARSASEIWAVGYFDDVTGAIPVRKTLWMRLNPASVVPSPNASSGDNTLLGVITPARSTSVWAWGASTDGTEVERFTP